MSKWLWTFKLIKGQLRWLFFNLFTKLFIHYSSYSNIDVKFYCSFSILYIIYQLCILRIFFYLVSFASLWRCLLAKPSSILSSSLTLLNSWLHKCTFSPILQIQNTHTNNTHTHTCTNTLKLTNTNSQTNTSLYLYLLKHTQK